MRGGQTARPYDGGFTCGLLYLVLCRPRVAEDLEVLKRHLLEPFGRDNNVLRAWARKAFASFVLFARRKLGVARVLLKPVGVVADGGAAAFEQPSAPRRRCQQTGRRLIRAQTEVARRLLVLKPQDKLVVAVADD